MQLVNEKKNGKKNTEQTNITSHFSVFLLKLAQQLSTNLTKWKKTRVALFITFKQSIKQSIQADLNFVEYFQN